MIVYVNVYIGHDDMHQYFKWLGMDVWFYSTHIKSSKLNNFISISISMGLWQWWIIHYLAYYIWASWLVGSVSVASSKKPKSKIIFESSQTAAKSQCLLLGQIILLTHLNGNFVLKSHSSIRSSLGSLRTGLDKLFTR